MLMVLYFIDIYLTWGYMILNSLLVMNKNPNREEVLLAWMLGSHFFPHLVVFDDISMVNTLDFFL